MWMCNRFIILHKLWACTTAPSFPSNFWGCRGLFLRTKTWQLLTAKNHFTCKLYFRWLLHLLARSKVWKFWLRKSFLGALDSVFRQLSWVFTEDAWYMLNQCKGVGVLGVFGTARWNSNYRSQDCRAENSWSPGGCVGSDSAWWAHSQSCVERCWQPKMRTAKWAL